MITLGVQYYRPPFPNSRYWEQDMVRIAAAGLNTVQLWVVWSWVEPSPGEFLFDDYDRLIELAQVNGLGVVLSTIAEVHPYWIHHEVPGSEMVDNNGNMVVSSNRREIHFGLTPGGCTDHPQVWAHMRRFLETVVNRYRSIDNLRGWDAWNELRWNVQADGLVCYCPHTLSAFRDWLSHKYGNLDGLNEAWQRRYRAWNEVLPGKEPGRPYTEMMAFEEFITRRANQHGKMRYDTIKALDPGRPVTVHGAAPSVLHGDQYPIGTALHRGNDWVYADEMDGIGCSSFPIWQGADDIDLTARLSFLNSAARGKRIWLSEVQGGRAATGFDPHRPVPAAPQQRWIWTGLAGGADTVLFWCWRDEVFGRESAGFGLVGNDGLAEERLEAMRQTGRVLERHAGLFEQYRPDPAQVGILFSPQSYYLYWAQEGSGVRPQHSVQGYARALIRANIPYLVVEEDHLDVLNGLKILFMPRVVVVDEPLAEALSAFVQRGGVLVAESECGAYGSDGLYRYPEDRFLAKLTGVAEIGRRTLTGSTVALTLGGKAFTLPATQWLTPYSSGRDAVLSTSAFGPLALDMRVGQGRVVMCGTYLGDPYYAGSALGNADFAPYSRDLEQFVAHLVQRAGIEPPVQVRGLHPAESAAVHVKTGRSGPQRLAFVFFQEGTASVRLRLPRDMFSGKVRDLISNQMIELTATVGGPECDLGAPPTGVMVLLQEL